MRTLKKLIVALGFVATSSMVLSPLTYVNATSQNQSVMTGYFEFTTTSNGYAIIEKYVGTDTYIEIPEVVVGNDGNEYTVVELSNQMLVDNSTVETVFIPKTVVNIIDALTYSSSIKEILVDSENPYFYSIDGVLIKNVGNYKVLYNYPRKKNGRIYVIPNEIDTITNNAFYKTQELTEVYVGVNIKNIGITAFNSMVQPVNIYIKNIVDLGVASTAFNLLQVGSHVIVSSDDMKSYIESKIQAGSINVLSLSDESNSAYRVPSTDLYFNDNTTVKNITLSPNETYSLLDQFTQEPYNTTDTVTWTSSDPTVATIKNGGTNAYTITAGSNAGKCTITGVDDSGRTLTVNVEVYIPMDKEDFDIKWSGSAIDESISVAKGEQLIFKADITPANCTALLEGVKWDTSNSEAVSISSIINATTVRLTTNTVGVSNVTATVVENGKEISKSIQVNVIEPITNCTIDSIPTQYYTGSEIRPSVVVKDGTKLLQENVDYTVTYSNNVNKGVAWIDIAGINNYYKSRRVYFDIEEPVVTPAPTVVPTTVPNPTVAPTVTPNTTAKPSQTTAPTVAPSTAPQGTVPSKVTKLSMKSNTSSKITLSWKKNTTATGYKIYRYDSKKKNYVLIKTITKNSTTSYTDSKRSNATAYKYRVCAYKKVNGKTYTGAYSSVLTAYTKPATVSLTKVIAGKKQAKVTWKKVANSSGYEVYRSTSKKGKYTKVKAVTSSKTVSFTNTKLKTGKTYYYKVRAYKTISVNSKKVKSYGDFSKVVSVKVK